MVWPFSSVGPGDPGSQSLVRIPFESAAVVLQHLHVLVHGAVSGELGLARRHFQVEVVDGECDDNDEGQNEAQDEGEGLFQAFPLIGDALVGCVKRRKRKSQHA